MKKITILFNSNCGVMSKVTTADKFSFGPSYFAEDSDNLEALAEAAFHASNAPLEILDANHRNIQLIWGKNRSLSVGDIVIIKDADDPHEMPVSFACAGSGWVRQ